MLIEYTRNGRRRTVNAKVGKLLIGRGLAYEVQEAAVEPNAGYQTRMLQSGGPALQAENTTEAPYGYKADGTPRKRPAPAAKKVDA